MMDKLLLFNFLEEKYHQYNSPEFIETDPIQIPHLFKLKQDREIAGFFAATLAWGQRKTIIKNARQLMEWMDYSPFEFVKNFNEPDLKPFKNFKHRTFNGEDCINFMKAFKSFYSSYNSLEEAFIIDNSFLAKESISNFKEKFLDSFIFSRTSKHIADPLKNSAAKRINMFLRWMVRNDHTGVDFGIWKNIKPKDLHCPLDIHSSNVARELGLLNRKQNDWKAVEELTNCLKELDPNDPVKYDYALFGLGVFEKF